MNNGEDSKKVDVENYTECPKCERRIKVKEKECPYCQYDLINRPKIEKEKSELLIKFKNFIQTESLIIESILAVIIVVMLVVFIGTNSEKVTIEKQYNELQAKLEDTSKTLQEQIKEKDNKITENEKKITELQQEEKKNEINESIKSLESEKQKLEEEKKTLEGEKQTLATQIEELKKTSSTITQSKSSSTTPTSSTTTAQNTNSAIVYVTNTGNKYHKSNCSYLKKSKIQITLSEAQSQGYTPCSKCY